MIARANPAHDGRRDSSGYARSVIVGPGRSILAAMIGTLCVVRVAVADPAALKHADYEGRWVSAKLTLPAMQAMNKAYYVNKQTPKKIASQFLQANGLK